MRSEAREVSPGQHCSFFRNSPGLIGEGGCTTGRAAKAVGGKKEGQVIADL